MKTLFYCGTVFLSITLIMQIAAEDMYHSQSGQDRFVHENCFNNVRDGFFVDIGAHDGITLSNTYFFEKHLGWRGICVEPLPTVFEQLKKNRTAICLNCCVSDSNRRSTFLMISGYSEMLSGLVDKYDASHRKRIMREVSVYGGTIDNIEVDCYTLGELAKQYGVSHINYLSIDTEGGEFDIIKSINFDELTIDVITVEDNYDDNQITDYLATKGFQMIGRTSDDRIFKRIVQ